MPKRFVGPDAGDGVGMGSSRSVRDYREYRRRRADLVVGDEQVIASLSFPATASVPVGAAAEKRRGSGGASQPRRRVSLLVVAPLCAVVLLAFGARLSPLPFKNGVVKGGSRSKARYTPAQASASVAALKGYERAARLLQAGKDPEAIAALHDAATAPVIVASSLGAEGKMASGNDLSLGNPLSTLIQTGAAMTRRARIAADANDMGTARLWLRRCRGLSDMVLQRTAPSLDVLALAHSLDSCAGNAERSIANRQEEIGLGNFDRLLLTAMREQNRKRLWRTQFQPALVAAAERRARALAAVTMSSKPGPEHDRRIAETVAAQDAIDDEIAADLIALYMVQRAEFAT